MTFLCHNESALQHKTFFRSALHGEFRKILQSTRGFFMRNFNMAIASMSRYFRDFCDYEVVIESV